MKDLIKPALIIAAILTCFFAFVIITQSKTQDEEDKKQLRRIALIGNIQFKGKVINSKVYDYGGKSYYLICVKLDYTTANNFYLYNDLCGIKIKNGIATMSAGVLNSFDGVTNYVEVNMNNNRKVVVHYKNGDKDEFMFTLDPRGISEKDMNSCN